MIVISFAEEWNNIQNLEKNKKSATEFYDLAFNQSKPREALEKYVGDKYIQHNPQVADGKNAFIAYFEKMGYALPKKN